MDKLMKLAGLHAVKRLAVQIYAGVLANKKLEDEGNKKATSPDILNFVFAGNPGTGKSTVADIFAELLKQAGAREGHRYVKMTAHEAMRKGAAGFATDMASLTGTVGGPPGPPPDPLREGLRVEVASKKNPKEYYPAQIVAVPTAAPPPTTLQGHSQHSNIQATVNHGHSTGYTVRYTDNTTEQEVDKKRIEVLGGDKKPVGGVLFFDEAYDLDPSNNRQHGPGILATIMDAAETHRESVSVILAGYKDEIEQNLFTFNPGMASRFITIPFEDFTLDQLKDIWNDLCDKGGWVCEDPKIVEIAGRRVARGIGAKGFGNARDMRKLFYRAVRSAKLRILNDDKAAKKSKDGKPLIQLHDLIGPKPTEENLPELKAALADLNKLVGLDKVKREIRSIVDLAKNNWEKENRYEGVDDVVLHRLFLGNPGTGKTSVAKIYGRVLKALRLLSVGDVVYKTASDFVGDHVGESAQKTKAIVELAQGKVLLIDEAYNLDDRTYGKQALDTLVERVTGAPGEDLAVVMCGYAPQMLKMIRDQNPGLARRFNTQNALYFENYESGELLSLVIQICRKMNLKVPWKVKRVMVERLRAMSALPNFGNAGDAITLISNAKRRMTDRLIKSNQQTKDAIMDEEDVVELDVMSVEEALDSLQDAQLRAEMEDLQLMVNVYRREGRPTESLLTHYVFTGDSGVGKTTTAVNIANILNAFKLIARPHVEVTSAMDLTGQYVGQTKEKVRKKMEAARGGVLFIDEAYAFNDSGGNAYATEAVTTLLSMLTEPDYKDGKIIVILAGYGEDMHEMLETNQGLKSRFERYIDFPSWTPQMCIDLVEKLGAKEKPPLSFDTSDLPKIRVGMRYFFQDLATRPGWANARDAVRLFKDSAKRRAVRAAGIKGATNVPITLDDVVKAQHAFLASRPKKSLFALKKKKKKKEAHGNYATQAQQAKKQQEKQKEKENEKEAEAEAEQEQAAQAAGDGDGDGDDEKFAEGEAVPDKDDMLAWAEWAQACYDDAAGAIDALGDGATAAQKKEAERIRNEQAAIQACVAALHAAMEEADEAKRREIEEVRLRELQRRATCKGGC